MTDMPSDSELPCSLLAVLFIVIIGARLVDHAAVSGGLIWATANASLTRSARRTGNVTARVAVAIGSGGGTRWCSILRDARISAFTLQSARITFPFELARTGYFQLAWPQGSKT